jgi:hypothetical protein
MARVVQMTAVATPNKSLIGSNCIYTTAAGPRRPPRRTPANPCSGAPLQHAADAPRRRGSRALHVHLEAALQLWLLAWRWADGGARTGLQTSGSWASRKGASSASRT